MLLLTSAGVPLLAEEQTHLASPALSMDCEGFMLMRMRGAYDETGSTDTALERRFVGNRSRDLRAPDSAGPKVA